VIGGTRDRRRDVVGVRDQWRNEDRQDAVDARIGQQHPQRVFVVLRRR
jgi:hypothetical protein